MAVPAHNRLIMSGVFGSATSPADIWSFRVSTGPRVFTAPERQAAAHALMNAYIAHLAPIMPSWVIATRARLSQHAAGGDTGVNGEGAYDQADSDTEGVPGTGGSTIVYPLATALTVSLGTERAGPTGKGRFFLPMPALALGGDFRLSEANAASVCTAARLFVQAINAEIITPGTQDDVCVVSSKGYVSRVTSLRVGRVPDTMRSRRNAQLEGYVTQAVV